MLELSVRHSWVRLMNNKDSVMTIHAERDSVCMGDDCNAPNARELPYSSDVPFTFRVNWINFRQFH